MVICRRCSIWIGHVGGVVIGSRGFSWLHVMTRDHVYRISNLLVDRESNCKEKNLLRTILL